MNPSEMLNTPGNGQAQHNGNARLFNNQETTELWSQWQGIQESFVDDPQNAVQKADELVGSVTKRLYESFSEERSRLEAEWSKGSEISTEDLRHAFRRYRSFFDRLLTV